MDQSEALQKLKDYSFRLIASRPRSISEMRQAIQRYSKKRSLPSELEDLVIEDLISRSYLDDAAFVQWWIEQRDSFRPKGDRLLEQELRQKGISVEVIRTVLSRQTERTDETEAALAIAQDRLRRLGSYPEVKQKEKLHRFLLSRGYGWEIVHAVIDSLFEKTYNTSEEL